MEFPLPDQQRQLRRSIAERDRVIVLGVSVLFLLPAALVASLFFTSILSIVLVTFVVGMVFATGLAFFLRSRFVAGFSAAELRVEPTGRSLSTHAQRNADELTGNGFALTDVVAVTDGADQVFTRPLALFSRVSDGQAAICSELGVQIVSKFGEHSLLVTASHEVVGHSSILLQMEPDANAAEVAASHNAVLAQIRSDFHLQPSLLDPLEALLEVERREQKTLVEATGIETLHRSLVDSGNTMSDEMLRGWLEEQSLLAS